MTNMTNDPNMTKDLEYGKERRVWQRVGLWQKDKYGKKTKRRVWQKYRKTTIEYLRLSLLVTLTIDL